MTYLLLLGRLDNLEGQIDTEKALTRRILALDATTQCEWWKERGERLFRDHVNGPGLDRACRQLADVDRRIHERQLRGAHLHLEGTSFDCLFRIVSLDGEHAVGADDNGIRR